MAALAPSLALPSLTAPESGLLRLGEPVRYSHRAAVARWFLGAEYVPNPRPYWRLTEGMGKNEPYPVLGNHSADEEAVLRFTEDDPFYERRRGRANKTVFVWPEEGEAVVVGLVRRAIGEGWRGARGGMFEDSEPGGFTADAYVDLYALGRRLRGVDYILAPWWAVTRKEETL